MEEVMRQITQHIEEIIDLKFEKMQKNIIEYFLEKYFQIELKNLETRIDKRFKDLEYQNKDKLQKQYFMTQPQRVIKPPQSSLSMQLDQSNIFSMCCQCDTCIIDNELKLDCGHIFHKKCIQDKVQTQIDRMNNPKGMCVGKINNQKCSQTIKIDQLGYDTNLKERLKKKQLQNQLLNFQDRQLSECPFSQCDNLFIINPKLPLINYCKCNRKYCLKCFEIVQNNHTCNKEFKAILRGKLCECGLYCQRKGVLAQINCLNLKILFVVLMFASPIQKLKHFLQQIIQPPHQMIHYVAHTMYSFIICELLITISFVKYFEYDPATKTTVKPNVIKKNCYESYTSPLLIFFQS
ncbi:hypothetical protein pb186bvf_011691 [Paramecium bursaria]